MAGILVERAIKRVLNVVLLGMLTDMESQERVMRGEDERVRFPDPVTRTIWTPGKKGTR